MDAIGNNPGQSAIVSLAHSFFGRRAAGLDDRSANFSAALY